MPTRSFNPVLLVLLVLVGLASAFSAFSARCGEEAQPEEGLDTILYNDPKLRPDQTKITKDDYLYVTGKHKIDLKKKSCDIKEVQYGEQDSEYAAGLSARDEGRYTVAAYHFVKSWEGLKGKTRTNWPAEYCNYQAGLALYTFGKFGGYTGKTGTVYDPPAVYFKRALEANPRSRFMPDMVSKIPICLTEEGKLDEAVAAIKDGEDKIKQYRTEGVAVAPGYSEVADRATAQLSVAAAKLAEKKASAAGAGADWQTVSDLWHSASGKCDRFPELQADAVDGELQALINMKNYDGVISQAQTYVDKYQSTGDNKVLPLLPGSYMALGKAFMGKAAQNEERKMTPQANQNYAEARWQFIHVVAQFFDKDEYVANAHFLAGVCYDKLKDLEPDAPDKAVRHWRLVVQNFPNSSFKALAEQQLATAGASIAPAPAPEPKKDEPKKDKT